MEFWALYFFAFLSLFFADSRFFLHFLSWTLAIEFCCFSGFWFLLLVFYFLLFLFVCFTQTRAVFCCSFPFSSLTVLPIKKILIMLLILFKGRHNPVSFVFFWWDGRETGLGGVSQWRNGWFLSWATGKW